MEQQQPSKSERLDISEEDQRIRLARQLMIVPGLAPPTGDKITLLSNYFTYAVILHDFECYTKSLPLMAVFH